MNKEKVYTAPSAEMLILVPQENLAAWEFGNSSWKIKNGYFSGENTASGVAINGTMTDWAEDGYTLN